MRFKRMLSCLILSLGLLVTSAMASAPSEGAEVPRVVTMSAGAMGQSLYMHLAVMSRWLSEAIPNLKATVIAGGSKANPRLVDRGTVDIAMTSHPYFRDAIKGVDPYKKKYEDLRFLANAQGYGAFYFMVLKKTGLKSIQKDFIDKKYPLKIGTFLKSGGPELNLRRLLKEYGVTYDDIKKWGGSVTFAQWGDLVNLLRDGHVESMLGNTSLPSHFHEEAAKARPMRLLPIPQAKIDTMIEKYGLLHVTIPKGTYGIVEEETPSFGYTYVVITHKRLHEKVAYEFVKKMAERADEVRKIHATFSRFDPKKMHTVNLGKIHPGAERYYKERGWLK